MADEVQKNCPSCGAPLKGEESFCTSCGAALGVPEAVAAGGPAAVPPQAAPPAGESVPGAPMPGTAPPLPAKQSKIPLLIGVVGGLLVIAGIVVLVMWLAVWRDGGGGGADTPVALAQKYMDSLENGDLDAYMACFAEDFFLNEVKDNPFTQNLSDEDIKEFARMAFEMMDVSFDDVTLEVKSEKGDEATVITTGGTARVSVMGIEETLDLDEFPMEFNMVKQNGTWFLTDNPMGADMSLGDLDSQDLDLDDLDLEELDQLLPEDLEDLDIEDLEQLLEDLEQQLEGTGV